MDTLAKRLSGAMQKSGFNQPGLARAATKPGAPVSQQVVHHLLSGRNSSSKHLPAIAEALGVSLDWLVRGGEPLAAAPARIGATGSEAGFAVTRSSGPSDRIPVLGMAQCGPDGWSLWNGEVIDTIPRPSNLMGAPRAYAVYIVGQSMEPRYFEGELAHIHPGKPVAVGDFVLVQIRTEHEGDAPKAVVKRLVRRTGSKIVLEQYNPAKKIDLKAADIVSIHKVVGSGDP
jgi:phage repressor protein C with HTH and peptisase S24 domain